MENSKKTHCLRHGSTVFGEADKIANFETSIFTDDGDYFLVQIIVKTIWRRMIALLPSRFLRLFECRLDLIDICSKRRVLSVRLVKNANGARFSECAGNGVRMERFYEGIRSA